MSDLPTASWSAAISDEVFVCRCEEVTAAEVRGAIDAGAISLNDVKRRTRAGMGLCQGIFCLRTIALMIEERAAEAPERIVPMTARPPARVISLSSLADLEP